jgi:hypothetical protein
MNLMFNPKHTVIQAINGTLFSPDINESEVSRRCDHQNTCLICPNHLALILVPLPRVLRHRSPLLNWQLPLSLSLPLAAIPQALASWQRSNPL